MSRLISMYGDYDRDEPGYPGRVTEGHECDIAVIGGGGSGLCAAARASQLGARVIVIEKMDEPGGNSRLAGGLLSTNSEYQKALGYEDRTCEYIRTGLSHNKYLVDKDIVARYLNNSGRLFDWLLENGLDAGNTRWILNGAVCLVKEPTEESPLNNPCYGPGLMGTEAVKILRKTAEENGALIITGAKADSIERDVAGRWRVTAAGQASRLEISASCVIICAGGFGASPELLRRFLPRYFSSDNYISHYCLKSSTGDGIIMAEKLGAMVGGDISAGIDGLAHIPGTYPVKKLSAEPVGIIVNKNGKRFISEDDRENSEFITDRQPDGMAYYVTGADGLEKAFLLAVEHIPNGDRIPSHEELEEGILSELKNGTMAREDNLEALAAYIGCDGGVLSKTVSDYNGFCAAGADPELYRAPETLFPVNSAPYYAVPLQRNFDVTMGGIPVNSGMQVLDLSSRPVPGLYAAGDNAGGWMGTDYGPLFSSFCWALNSGYLAGEQAAEAAGKGR